MHRWITPLLNFDPDPAAPAGGGGGTDPATPPAPAGDPPAATWRDTLPDDLKGVESLKSINSVADLAKGYVHAQAMVGANKVALPGKNATPDEWGKFYTAIGRPDKPEGYQFPTEGLPEGVTIADADKQRLAATAHKLGLTPTQAALLYREYAAVGAEGMKASVKAKETQQDEWLNAIKGEFGAAYDERVGLAKDAVEKLGGKDLKEYLDETGLGNHPAMVKAFAEVGKMIASDEINGHGSGRQFSITPTEANSKISAKHMDAEWTKAYFDERHPGHKAAVEEMRQLQEAAHPEPAAT